jgi:HEAT repeat protein
MDHPNPPPTFEQTSVYQLAATWLEPAEMQEALEWLLPLTDPDPEQRRAAVSRMSNTSQRRDPRMRVPLLVALHDPDARVRGEAAHAMLFFRDPRAVEPLIAILRDTEMLGRSTAALALGLLGDQRAVQPLIAIFQEETAQRKQAALERGRPFFLDIELEMVVGALVRLADPDAVEPLIAALRDLFWRGTGKVAQALGQLQDQRAVKPLLAALHETVTRAQQLIVTDPSRHMPILADGLFWAVGKFKDRRAVQPLLSLLATPCLPTWDQRLVVITLGQIGDARAVGPLRDKLQMQSLWVRLAAARALELLADTYAVPALCAALKARSGHLRAAAARSLGQIGDPRAVEPLLPLTQDTRVSVRQAALGALCRMGDARALEPLLALLQNGSKPQRRAAAKALGRIGDVRARESLLIALYDQDRAVRTAARKTLDQCGLRAGSSPRLLSDSDPDPRTTSD